MGKVVADITTPLDGFVAGPNDGPELPLGEGASGYISGCTTERERRSAFLLQLLSDPISEDEDRHVRRGLFADGIESALEQARAAAGEKDVGIGGGASTIQQYLRAGLLDEIQIHIAPMLLGRGIRLFADPGYEQVDLQRTRVVEGDGVTHLRFRVVGQPSPARAAPQAR